jgi:PQQ-like domain
MTWDPRQRGCWLSSALLLCACSRSGLYAFASEAPPDDAGATIADAGAVMPSACTAAIEPGAPAAMFGYCSTQANVAPTRVPVGPHGTWGVQIGTYAPSQIVVDASGQVYVGSCDLQGDTTSCTQIVSVTPQGTVAWTHDFGMEGVRGFFIGADAKLHVVAGFPRTLYALDRNALVTILGPLPDGLAYQIFPGSDGSLYGSLVDYAGMTPDRVVKMSATGAPVWTTPLACNDCISAMAVAADDSVAVTLTAADGDGGLAGTLLRIDGAGNLLWTRALAGFSAERIAVARDGSIRIALWTQYQEEAAPSSLVLASYSASGDLAWQTDLHQDPEQTGDDPLVVLEDGTTVLRSFTDLNAVGADGRLLWHKTLRCPNCAYSAAGDPDGGVVVLADDIEGIDVATGSAVWSGIVPPQDGGNTVYFGSMMVLGRSGTLVGASFGGMVFSAADP